MFNPVKKAAKRASWANLRASQRIAFNSGIGADPRIDTRLFMVALGAFSIFRLVLAWTDVSSSQKDAFINNVYERADKDIYMLLGEYRMDQLPKGTFKFMYESISISYLEAQSIGDETPLHTAMETMIRVSLKDELSDDKNIDYIFEEYQDEIFRIIMDTYVS